MSVDGSRFLARDDSMAMRQSRRFRRGVKRIARKSYKVIYMFGAWLILSAGKLIAIAIKNVIHTFSREVGKGLARRILTAA